jgi:hypothetical protein
MRKINRVERSVLVFMAGTPGRITRGVMGIALIALAISGGGWWLLLGLPGLMMIATGVMNYCPAGLAITGSGKSQDIMEHIAKYDALGSSVNKY